MLSAGRGSPFVLEGVLSIITSVYAENWHIPWFLCFVHFSLILSLIFSTLLLSVTVWRVIWRTYRLPQIIQMMRSMSCLCVYSYVNVTHEFDQPAILFSHVGSAMLFKTRKGQTNKNLSLHSSQDKMQTWNSSKLPV